jgi:hypothetical protein
MKDKRYDDIVLLRSEGRTLESIGEIYGVSRQRVHQILKSSGVEKRYDFRRFKIKHVRTAIFWEHMNMQGKDDCWDWQYATTQKGYGVFLLNGKQLYSHRVAYSLIYGEIPCGMEICHKCDNPLCCNPAHLFAGTHLENMLDMKNKGRSPDLKGEKSGGAKLTNEQVITIRNSNKSQCTLAMEYGTSQAQISRIKSRISWNHIQ